MPSFQYPTFNRELKVERREDAPFRPFCSKRCKLIDLYESSSWSLAAGNRIAPGVGKATLLEITVPQRWP